MKKILLSIACLFGTLFSNAQSGAALNFDGGDDYIDIGTAITQTNSYTKEAWIYANASGSNNIISSGSSPFWLAGGQLSVAHGWGGGFILSDPSSFPLNTWTHVAVTFDSSTNTLILYKNGAVVAMSTSAPAYVAESIQIGAYGASNFFQGMIDEVRLWNVVRTQCEIISYMNCEIPATSTGLAANYHFNQGVASGNNISEVSLTDATGNNPGTLINFSLNGSSSNWVSPGGVISGSITPSACSVASALNFDGTDDHIQLPVINLMNSSFTMETWAKRNSTGGSFNALFGQGNTSTDQGLHIGFRNDNTFTLAFYGDDLNTSTTYTDLNWHHWAVTYDAAINEQKIYLDGILVASGISGADYNGSGNLFVGKTAWGGDNFNGNMDEVRVWNVARTQCEINTYMNCEIPTNASGLVANYHFNQGIDGFNNSTITTLNDASGNNLAGSLNNFSLVGSGSNWIAPGGVANGYTTTTVCPPASALNFDGSDDHVTLNPINISGAAARTIEFWIKTNYTGNFQTPFASGSANPSQAFNFKVTPSGYLGFMGFANDIYPSSGTYIADNVFHHVAITYDGTTAKAYVDGNHEWDFTAALNTVGENNLIGWSNHGGYEQPFGGTIDELRIWNVVRTQCEIISYKNCEIPASSTGLVANYHFNQGYDMMSNPSVTTLTDASGNTIDGTLSNFALSGSGSNWVSPGGVVSGFTTSIACPVAAALDFDGNDDGVDIGNSINTTLDPLNTITVEAWVNPSTTTWLGVIAGNYATSGSGMQFLLRRDFDTYAFWVDDGTGFHVVSSNPSSVMVGEWQHVAGVWDGSELRIYVDGMLNSTNSGITGSDFAASSNNIFIGRDNANESFMGSIDEVRIWSTPRTQCEINTYMNSEISNSMTGLLANYHFNQGLSGYANLTETVLTDVSGNGYNGTLNNFALTGTTSNWVAPGGVVSGYTTTTITPPVVTVNSGAICAGQSFTMVPGGALTYTYSNGSSVATPTADATYTVTGADAVGCENMATSSVTVNTLPTISVNDGTICAGQSFTMTPSGAVTYTYSNGSDVAMPTSDATYTITGTDVNGCENMAVSSVTVNALPTLMAMSTTTLLCTGETATLSVTGASSYTWSTTETTPDIAVTPTAQTTYTVDGTDANGCSNTTIITQDVSLCTGIAYLNNVIGSAISVYPNPNNGAFTIDLNAASKITVENALGQVILTTTMENGRHSIDIQNQSTGIYFVKVIQDGKQHTIKLVKE